MSVHTNWLRYGALSRDGHNVPEIRQVPYGIGFYIPDVKLPDEFSTNGKCVDLEDVVTGRLHSVLILSRRQASIAAPKSIRPHRVFCRCQYCGKFIPAGRLLQHEHACINSSPVGQIDQDLRRWAVGGV